MNDVELREQFEQWAAPLRASTPPPVTAIRRRARHRTARIAGTTASAVAAVVVVAIVVAAAITGSPAAPAPSAGVAFWGSASYPAPPGQPYVLVNESAAGPAELRDMATRTVVGVVPLVGKGVMFTALAAAPGDRMFVIAWQDRHGELGFDSINIGKPGTHLRAVRLPILPLHGAQVYGMTVNPAGTRLVFNTIPPGGTAPGTLHAYNLVSGALIGRWPAAGIVSLDYWPAADQLAIHTGAHSGLRILNTDSTFPAGSSLAADTQPDPGVRGYGRGALTADGSRAMNVRQAGQQMQVEVFSAASGRLMETIPIGPASALQDSSNFCGVLWASANGRELLTQCGSRQQEVVDGHVTPTRLAWTLLAQQDGAIGTFAW
jgi:hypothetical protein